MWLMCVVDRCGQLGGCEWSWNECGFGWCVAGRMWVVERCGWLWGVGGCGGVWVCVVGGVWVVTGV